MGGRIRVPGDKTTIEVGKAQKALDVPNALRGSLVEHSIHIFRVHLDAIGGDNEPKEDGLFHIEFTLLRLNEPDVLQSREYLAHLLPMFFHGPGVDEYVVYVHYAESIEQRVRSNYPPHNSI